MMMRARRKGAFAHSSTTLRHSPSVIPPGYAITVSSVAAFDADFDFAPWSHL